MDCSYDGRVGMMDRLAVGLTDSATGLRGYRQTMGAVWDDGRTGRTTD